MAGVDNPVLVVEDDPFPRTLQVILDLNASAERRAALARVVAHELQNFEGWSKRMRDLARGSTWPKCASYLRRRNCTLMCGVRRL